MLQWGPDLDELQEVIETGLAEFWETQPELPEYLGWVWDAFWAVSSCRAWGAMGGAGPLSWTAIDRYAQRFAIVGDEFDELCELLRAMDGAYLAHLAHVNSKPVAGGGGGG